MNKHNNNLLADYVYKYTDKHFVLVRLYNVVTPSTQKYRLVVHTFGNSWTDEDVRTFDSFHKTYSSVEDYLLALLKISTAVKAAGFEEELELLDPYEASEFVRSTFALR
jgi:hypothetical protein